VGGTISKSCEIQQDVEGGIPSFLKNNMEKYKRKHNSFSKLKKGDTLTDINNDTFEVLRIDNFNKKVYVRDLQSTNDEFWLDSKYVNKPELLS